LKIIEKWEDGSIWGGVDITISAQVNHIAFTSEENDYFHGVMAYKVCVANCLLLLYNNLHIKEQQT
jgi:hypothetical protein